MNFGVFYSSFISVMTLYIIYSMMEFPFSSSGHFDVEDTNTSVVTTEPTKTLFDIGIHEAQVYVYICKFIQKGQYCTVVRWALQ